MGNGTEQASFAASTFPKNNRAGVLPSSGGAPANASFVVMGLNATLTDERVLTAGPGLSLLDGGAGGAATLSILSSAITRAMLADGAGWSVIGRSAAAAGPVADIAAAIAGDTLRLKGGVLGFGDPDFGAQNIASTGVINIGTTPALSGLFRGGNNLGGLVFRSSAPFDIAAVEVNAANQLIIGDAANLGNMIQQALSGIFQRISGADVTRAGSSQFNVYAPLIGDGATAGNVNAINGDTTSAMGNADFIVPTTEYRFLNLKFVYAATANRTATFPLPASTSAGYIKIIQPSLTDPTRSLIVSVGVGPSAAILSGLKAIVYFSSTGCEIITIM